MSVRSTTAWHGRSECSEEKELRLSAPNAGVLESHGAQAH